jgi:hypothetical protein
MGQTLRQSHPNAIAYPAVEVSTLNAGAPTMEAVIEDMKNSTGQQ